MRLRPATDADWPAAWDIQREAFLPLVTETWGGWDEAMERKCRDGWCAADTRMVEIDGAVVGWVQVEHREDHDWLELIAVASAHQGAGLGTTLLRLLIDAAHGRGVPLVLSVYRTNAARRLYLRLGFTEEPRDALRVRMTLPPGGTRPSAT
ncbi:MAG: GNAT family N-acetyltransferase [Alphaproteobacteria bacterium]|nr:GNAT family N-acetyltransferase [Alphaproteobacteria bacterium]